MQMTDPANGDLRTFLTKAANGSSTLIFAGHSLGGALSPTLALFLYPQPQESGWKQVLVLPTAGASPGNEPFAKLFAAAYPPVASGVSAPYGTWNTNYANAADAVPHAWNLLDEVIISQPDPAGNYQSIYGVMDPGLALLVGLQITDKKNKASGGDYMNITKSQFTPTWGCWSWQQNPDGTWQHPPVWTELARYTDSNPIPGDQLPTLIGAAHIDQYDQFFGVTPAPRMAISEPAAKAPDAKAAAD